MLKIVEQLKDPRMTIADLTLVQQHNIIPKKSFIVEEEAKLTNLVTTVKAGGETAAVIRRKHNLACRQNELYALIRHGVQQEENLSLLQYINQQDAQDAGRSAIELDLDLRVKLRAIGNLVNQTPVTSYLMAFWYAPVTSSFMTVLKKLQTLDLMQAEKIVGITEELIALQHQQLQPVVSGQSVVPARNAL